MVTIFSLPKPFRGHIGIIQRNAITSWTRLQPRPEIILFGKEEGTAEIAAELGLRHVTAIEANEFGTPLLSDMFKTARNLASNKHLCYINADIILVGKFTHAVQEVASWRDRFLMVGRRTNLDLGEPLQFDSPDWERRLRSLVRQSGSDGPPYAIDYFVYPGHLFPEFPAFAIGRPRWDNWFLWKTRSLGLPLVDATEVVLAIHQNHDYSHQPGGLQGDQHREEARRNRELAGDKSFCTIVDATHRLIANGIKWNFRHLFAPHFGNRSDSWWQAPADSSRAIRHHLGLTRAGLGGLLVMMGLMKTPPEPGDRGA